MIFNNFKVYIPTEEDKVHLLKTFKIEFLMCEEGFDWYDVRNKFKPDSVKVIFDPDTYIIKSISKDVDTLHPRGVSIAEIEGDYESDDLNIIENKIFDVQSMSIIDRVYTEDEQEIIVERKIQHMKKYANSEIEPLTYAKELKMITDEETVYLQELKKYIVLLNRIPNQKGYPTDIKWPQVPNKI